MQKKTSPLDKQIGGAHYKSLAIQPAEYNQLNRLNYMEGSVVKYVTRWKEKGGVSDLEKAIHCLELLIELEKKTGIIKATVSKVKTHAAKLRPTPKNVPKPKAKAGAKSVRAKRK